MATGGCKLELGFPTTRLLLATTALAAGRLLLLAMTGLAIGRAIPIGALAMAYLLIR